MHLKIVVVSMASRPVEIKVPGENIREQTESYGDQRRRWEIIRTLFQKA